MSMNQRSFNPTSYNFTQIQNNTIMNIVWHWLEYKNRKLFLLKDINQDYISLLLNTRLNHTKTSEVLANILSIKWLLSDLKQNPILEPLVEKKIQETRKQLKDLLNDNIAKFNKKMLTFEWWSLSNYCRIEFIKGNIALNTQHSLPEECLSLFDSIYNINIHNQFALKPNKKLENTMFSNDMYISKIWQKITWYLNRIISYQKDFEQHIDELAQHIENSGIYGIPNISHRRSFLTTGIKEHVQYLQITKLEKLFWTYYNDLKDSQEIPTTPAEILANKEQRVIINNLLSDICQKDIVLYQGANLTRRIYAAEKYIWETGVSLLWQLLIWYQNTYTLLSKLLADYGDNPFFDITKDANNEYRNLTEVDNDCALEQRNPLWFLNHQKFRGSMAYRNRIMKKYLALEKAEKDLVEYLCNEDVKRQINRATD